MKKNKIILVVLLILFLASCGETYDYPDNEQYEEACEIPAEEEHFYGADSLISRALAARMLALSVYSRHRINSMRREIAFYDTNPDKWHDRYINAVFAAGLMMGGGDVFMPDELLTYAQAQVLLSRLYPGIVLDFTPSAEPISYANWTKHYLQALEGASNGDISGFFDIHTISIIPVQAAAHGVFTDGGPFDSAGIDFAPYIDKRVTVLAKEGSILAILGVDKNPPLVRGAYIVSFDGEYLTAFIGGAKRVFRYQGFLPEGKIADIRVSHGMVIYTNVLSDVITETVKRVTPEFTELGDLPRFQNSPDIKVYNLTGGTARLGGIRDIKPGSVLDFALENGTIRAVIINNEADVRQVRVLLSTTGFNGYLHEWVSIQSDTHFTVWSMGFPFAYAPGDIFTVSPRENTHMFTDENRRIFVIPNLRNGRLEVLNIERGRENDENPRYRGVLEISKEDCGRFLIINELPLEEYLYAVVSSDIFHSHGAEFANLQAAAARSFAYIHFHNNLFHTFGANFDDSVISQVYNNLPENPQSIAGVNRTRGLMLSYGGSVIVPTFFSTSAGLTANSGEVWANFPTGDFPGTTLPYLRSSVFHSGGNFGSLRDEANASAFLRDTGISGYDSAFPWFRWNVNMTAQELTLSINTALSARYATDPNLILTLQPDGYFRSRPIETIGWLQDMEVLERGEGGNIMSMLFTGSEAVIIVHTELNIRSLLAPVSHGKGRDIEITRHIGEPAVNFPLMPSAFFVVDIHLDDDGNLGDVTFYGGGQGHGVGMSMNGARGMLQGGATFRDVFRRYYRGAVLVRRW